MDRNSQNERDYTRPDVPPAVPPAIDRNADAQDAALRAQDSGDSDYEGSNRSDLDRSAEEARIQAGHAGAEHGNFSQGHSGTAFAAGGDSDRPGQTPDEVRPGRGDQIQPTGPSEIEVEREDTDEPGATPEERPDTPVRPETLPPD